jgi:hypothetical protein
MYKSIKSIIERTTDDENFLSELEKVKEYIDDEINERKNKFYHQKIKDLLDSYSESKKITKKEYKELEKIKISKDYTKTYTSFEENSDGYYIIDAKHVYNLKYKSVDYCNINVYYHSRAQLHIESDCDDETVYNKIDFKHTRFEIFCDFMRDLFSWDEFYEEFKTLVFNGVEHDSDIKTDTKTSDAGEDGE